MAGETEEPIKLVFQAGTLHSGSISFGRFESEPLCWERRSSFSHNRYLEEVEKCSKPGSVIEKKAYFEAHFRKKGILGLSLPESQNETKYESSEYGISEKMVYDEEINPTNTEIHSACFDQSLVDSVQGREHSEIEHEKISYETLNSEAQIGLSCYSTSNSDSSFEHCKREEAHHATLASSLSTHSGSGIKMKENLDGEAENSDTNHVPEMIIGHGQATKENSDASPKDEKGSTSKKKIQSEAEYMEPRLAPKVSVTQSRRHVSSKGLEKKSSKQVNDVLLRLKTERKTLAAASQNKCSVYKTPKYELGSKEKGVKEIKRGEESRDRGIVKPQSCTSQKVSSRVYHSANRTRPAAGTCKQGMEQNGCRLSFKCNEHAERRKELDMKLTEKMHVKEAGMHQLQAKTQEKTEAKIKHLQKSINFKATPLPSFYHGASDRNKAVASIAKPAKLRTKSSSIKGRASESSPLSSTTGKNQELFISPPPKITDRPRTPGATSCHSTVTTDSGPSSPAAETSMIYPSHTGINSYKVGNKEKEKNKHTSLHKHKVPEGNYMISGGKTMQGKLKKNPSTRHLK